MLLPKVTDTTVKFLNGTDLEKIYWRVQRNKYKHVQEIQSGHECVPREQKQTSKWNKEVISGYENRI